ncbi:MAG: winged helix-turn-helix transcriptional regulator [Algicola sp.]|nr:winged helix-turn-helix transcriptional regulator [Algicola sp.]
MKNTYFQLFVIISLSVICSVLLACTNQSESKDPALVKIALREAGNQLLLQQNDSTSIIFPIVATEEYKYQLSFEKELSFEPNELVQVIDSSFALAGIDANYRVEVLQCTDLEVAYSYEMQKTQEQTIIPCGGRYLPQSCYQIEVQFLNPQTRSLNPFILLGCLTTVVLLIFYYSKNKSTMSTSTDASSNYAEIGSYHFYPEQNKLVKQAQEISLSRKECELLELFIAQPNQVIKRDELTKRVWEDNGVIVGRSLDTYISKLRKKLKDDPSIKLTNVHGVGYKLELI